MKCVIPGANLKVFARAVHSLSKIGDEIYIEALQDGIALRTVNSSRSAYACFVFVSAFFVTYNGPDKTKSNSDDDSVIKCKIMMKSCLTVFKSLSTLEKTVEKCRLSLNLDSNRLVFQLYCKHGIVKTYNLSFIECETLQAVFSKDFSPNVLVSQSKLFHDVVGNFQSGQEEITLVVNPEKVTVRNYIDDEPDPLKVIRTELTLLPEEFEDYRVGVDTEVTFCLKELRALLAFSEPPNLPLSMYFEAAGRPIILAIDSDPSFEANFVLATLADTSTQISSSQRSVAPASVTKGTTSTSKRGAKAASSSRGQKSQARKPPSVEMKTKKDVPSLQRHLSKTFGRGPNEGSSRTMREFTALPDRSTSALDVSNVNEGDDVEIADASVIRGETSSAAVVAAAGSDAAVMNSKTQTGQPNKTSMMSEQTEQTATVSGLQKTTDSYSSPVIPIQPHAGAQAIPSNSKVTSWYGEPSDDDDDDLVPGTPPCKKYRSYFFGLSQSTNEESSQPDKPLQPPPVVLAEDSDEG